MKVYLASPFFNEEELENYDKVLQILENKNLDVYAPLLNEIDRKNLTRMQWANKTFQKDIEAIQNADIVVMLFYGLYSDSGTSWECGYSFALNKKIIAVHLHNGKSNCMINCSCYANINGLKELESYDFNHLPQISYYTEDILG